MKLLLSLLLAVPLPELPAPPDISREDAAKAANDLPIVRMFQAYGAAGESTWTIMGKETTRMWVGYSKFSTTIKIGYGDSYREALQSATERTLQDLLPPHWVPLPPLYR